MAMGNFYLLNRKEGWAAVSISKNGCTSLKARVLEDDGYHLEEYRKMELHNKIGYDASSKYLVAVGEGAPEGMRRFVVVRDPVERFLSVFRHFELDRAYHHEFRYLKGASFDVWMDYTEEELKKPVLLQDEHLRCQMDYWREEDVDDVVPLRELNVYFLRQGWRVLERENRSKAFFEATACQVERLRWIYRRDLRLMLNMEGGG